MLCSCRSCLLFLQAPAKSIKSVDSSTAASATATGKPETLSSMPGQTETAKTAQTSPMSDACVWDGPVSSSHSAYASMGGSIYSSTGLLSAYNPRLRRSKAQSQQTGEHIYDGVADTPTNIYADGGNSGRDEAFERYWSAPAADSDLRASQRSLSGTVDISGLTVNRVDNSKGSLYGSFQKLLSHVWRGSSEDTGAEAVTNYRFRPRLKNIYSRSQSREARSFSLHSTTDPMAKLSDSTLTLSSDSDANLHTDLSATSTVATSLGLGSAGPSSTHKAFSDYDFNVYSQYGDSPIQGRRSTKLDCMAEESDYEVCTGRNAPPCSGTRHAMLSNNKESLLDVKSPDSSDINISKATLPLDEPENDTTNDNSKVDGTGAPTIPRPPNVVSISRVDLNAAQDNVLARDPSAMNRAAGYLSQLAKRTKKRLMLPHHTISHSYTGAFMSNAQHQEIALEASINQELSSPDQHGSSGGYSESTTSFSKSGYHGKTALISRDSFLRHCGEEESLYSPPGQEMDESNTSSSGRATYSMVHQSELPPAQNKYAGHLLEVTGTISPSFSRTSTLDLTSVDSSQRASFSDLSEDNELTDTKQEETSRCTSCPPVYRVLEQEQNAIDASVYATGGSLHNSCEMESTPNAKHSTPDPKLESLYRTVDRSRKSNVAPPSVSADRKRTLLPSFSQSRVSQDILYSDSNLNAPAATHAANDLHDSPHTQQTSVLASLLVQSGGAGQLPSDVQEGANASKCTGSSDCQYSTPHKKMITSTRSLGARHLSLSRQDESSSAAAVADEEDEPQFVNKFRVNQKPVQQPRAMKDI